MFEGKFFNVEHALQMNAYSVVNFPAQLLYDRERLAEYQDLISRCHVYMVGFLPDVHLDDMEVRETELVINFRILQKPYEIGFPMPPASTLKKEDGKWFVERADGVRIVPNMREVIIQLERKFQCLTFEVQYIGQAYGTEGSRNAVDRLLKHEKLQELAVKGAPVDQHLELLLIEIQPRTTVLTVFNPWASHDATSDERIEAGFDKLYGTSVTERITLYEASLIRYFQPTLNKEFRNSFPSTKLGVLKDCYQRDFSAVVAEIVFEDMPFRLSSPSIVPAYFHTAVHDLHTEANRQLFFGLTG